MRLLPLPALALALTLAACSRGDEAADAAARGGTTAAASPSGAAAAPDAAGGQVITTADGSVNLGLAGDTVWMNLSDSAQAALQKSLGMDSAGDQGGVGAAIERGVKQAVSSVVTRRIERSLAQIRDVRYEGGAIVFDYVDRPAVSFESIKVGNRPALEAFRPEDAQRFVEAVRAAKARQ